MFLITLVDEIATNLINLIFLVLRVNSMDYFDKVTTLS